MLLEILSLGSGLSIQDQGRIGWRRFGVPTGGAMDVGAMQQANRLLGNSLQAPVLEIVQQGARIRILRDTWLSLTGADFCSQLAAGTAQRFTAGEVLEMDLKSHGLYSYLAVPGGMQSNQWLGSASSDLRNGMGLVLKKCSKVDSLAQEPNISIDRVARRLSAERSNVLPEAHFELYPGPQFDGFSTEVQKSFIDSEWVVSVQSDRTGYRLEGTKLKVPPMIASQPVLPGSFQISGNGQPIVTMHDGPTVGGYAKLAILKAKDLDRFAQCAPGTQITFSWIH